jgi:DNA-directed RNA polymerase subunit RPC12/RpoP
MTKSDPWHNTYSCPSCEADVAVTLPVAKYVTCPECHSKLEIHPDAEFEDGLWHDRTELAVIDSEREHMKRMLKHLQQHGDKT